MALPLKDPQPRNRVLTAYRLISQQEEYEGSIDVCGSNLCHQHSVSHPWPGAGQVGRKSARFSIWKLKWVVKHLVEAQETTGARPRSSGRSFTFYRPSVVNATTAKRGNLTKRRSKGCATYLCVCRFSREMATFRGGGTANVQDAVAKPELSRIPEKLQFKGPVFRPAVCPGEPKPTYL